MFARRRSARQAHALLVQHAHPDEAVLAVADARRPGAGAVTLVVTDRALYALPPDDPDGVLVLPLAEVEAASLLGEVLLVRLRAGDQVLYGIPASSALPGLLADQVLRVAAATTDDVPPQRVRQRAARRTTRPGSRR